MFSGGVGSWAAAKRTAFQHGTEGLTLLFADTLIEDEDLYRFLADAAANVGGQFVRQAEGRDPWQVFFDKRYLGNTRIDPCSAVLKRDFMRKWLVDNCDPANTTVVLGFDWTEPHRVERSRPYWAPWRIVAPLIEKPYLSKPELLDWLKREGIEAPRLYREGFSHNNCGGFCIKAGQAQFRRLLLWNRERYLYHEGREQELRAYLKADVAIMRDRAGGIVRPLTMREFRERIEAGDACDPTDVGGCGCFEVQADLDFTLSESSR